MRTNVYIDGFNFYYGAIRGREWKWLDLEKFCRGLLPPSHQLKAIRYFTARVSDDPYKAVGQAERQHTYLRAVKRCCPSVEIHYGYFLRHVKKFPLVQPPDNRRAVEVWHTEEKGSDVNLAVHLLNDAWLNAYDCAVVVSNDSDLAGGIRLVKALPKKVIGWAPPCLNGARKPSQKLRKYADFNLNITSTLLRESQLPEIISGTNLRKPANW